jgi:prolyl-tRNA editing enzyme YbaK/EbsC (Cys-tRNA(Pro) deacylase)
VAKKPTHPTVTQKHVDNANEIAQMLQAMKAAQPQEAPEPTGPMPGGVSPLGGQAK